MAVIITQPAIMEREFVTIAKTTLRVNFVENVKSVVMEMQRPMDVFHAVAMNMAMKKKAYVIKKRESVIALRTLRVKTVRIVRVGFMEIQETAVVAIFNVNRVQFFKQLNHRELDRLKVTWMSVNVCGY